MKAIRIFLLLPVMLMLLGNLNAQEEGTDSENDFLSFYSQHKDILDQEAPYANTLESFAEYHDALLDTVMEFERSGTYEDEFPIEGKVTELQRTIRTIRLFKMLVNEAHAVEKGEICFYGGWPSRMVGGKCQAPWKNKEDSELKKLGATYTSEYYCGGVNLFRCNPMLFGPGKSGKGICISFKKVSEITNKCYAESRDQIERLYESFKTNPLFRKNYIATVSVMITFCANRKTYPACRLLTLQAGNMVTRSCGQTMDLSEMLSTGSIVTLYKELEKISIEDLQQLPPKAIPRAEIPRARIVKELEEEYEEEVATEVESGNSQEICSLYKSFKAKGVPAEPLLQVLTYYKSSKSRFGNDRFVTIADYSQNSRKKRFYLLDLVTGAVSQEKVSHGSGTQNGVKLGDKGHDGMLDRCTSSRKVRPRENMTRPGFYKVEGYYTSKSHIGSWPSLVKGSNLNGMKLVGLSTTNDDALGRGVVMHEANYNSDGNAVMGRSYGCPAFAPGKGAPLMSKMRGGSLFYAYAPVCAGEMNQVLKDPKVKNWKNSCKK
jgi:hypothetical protein